MKNLKLRKATIADNEFAYQIKKSAFGIYVEKTWGWDETEQRQLHKRRFNARNISIIQFRGTDIGILNMVHDPDCIRINQIFIHPKHQNQGIGTECVLMIMTEARQSQLPIRLQVLKVNCRAITFYLKLGFNIVGETDTHILMERAS